ncbi:hypothetical protein [Hydrogenispora ethanolica]|nr:hypothetical protein [Hydrogenispora ethanolica]
MNFSIADRIRRSQNMLAGLNANSEKLAKRGIDAQFLTQYTAEYQTAIDLDGEHEAAKARAKERTAAFHSQLEKADEYYAQARKLVKLEIPQDLWKEFGIYDER